MQKSYDVTIIGGGIQGCGIAQALAASGYETLLLEKNTWGSGTSSKSSKLIHGGLRYLQTAQFSLVRESLFERDWMIEHIPDLVKPNWFYIPIYNDSYYRPWKVATGLSLYQMLCGFSKYSTFKKVPKPQWINLDGIKTEGLKAVYAYQDAQTDDQKLTEHVAQSATSLGAVCLENANFTRAAAFEDGFRLCYTHDGKETCLHSKLVINASGPWINHTLACFTPALEPLSIDLVQGTHIILEQSLSDHCFYLEATSDQRAVFVMPWKGHSLVGTTETLHKGTPETCKPLESEVDYLLNTVQHYFPDQTLNIKDCFAGLRVLPKMKDRPFNRPRDVQCRIDGNLINIYGGKLTSWRHTAEQAKESVEFILGKRKAVNTRKLKL